MNKKKLWEQFDNEVNKDKVDLVCVYESQELKARETCSLCNSSLYVAEERFLTCSNEKCGVMYRDTLDESAEWRYYGAEDSGAKDPTRCGMPINPLLKKSSYGCKVVCTNRSTYEMRKIRRYTEWQSMPYEEKTQYDEFEWIKSMARQSGIAKIIVDEAMRQHKKISEMKTFRGYNRDGIIAASVYIACRIHNFPRTAKEIATIFHLDNTSATKGCKNAGQILNNIEDNNERTQYCETKPRNFIERFCSKLNINKVRSGNVIGGGERAKNRLFTDLIQSFNNNLPIEIRNPKHIRPWQYILDSLYGYLLIAKNSYENNTSEVFNLNSEINNHYEVRQITELFKNFSEHDKEIVFNDVSSYKEVDILKINSSKAENDLKWKAKVEIPKIIELIIKWEEHHKKIQNPNYSFNEIESYLNI